MLVFIPSRLDLFVIASSKILQNASSKNDENEAFTPSKERFHAYLSGSYVFRGLFCSYNVFSELAARKKHFNATQIRTPESSALGIYETYQLRFLEKSIVVLMIFRKSIEGRRMSKF